MALNFDQFNNNSLVQREPNIRLSDETQIVPSGYVQIKKNYEKQIFTKSKMNVSLPASISFLSVANDQLVVFMSNQLLFRLNLKHPDKQSEVFLEKFITGQRVSNIFLDPTGSHLLLSLSPKTSGYSAELMYLNKNSNKPKIITKVTHRHSSIKLVCKTYSSFIFFPSSEIMKSLQWHSILKTLRKLVQATSC